MKKHTKKFRAVVRDGTLQGAWREQQTGETLLPDDVLAFEADTLPKLVALMTEAGIIVPDAPVECGTARETYTRQEYEDAIVDRLDREAQAAPYLWDSMDRVASFAESTVPKYRAEARYFIALRDACWLLCFDALENPPDIQPTPAEFAETIMSQALAQVSNKTK